MFEWKRICCPVDFADPSRAAMEHAAALASHFKAELTLVHVLPPSSGAPNGEFGAPREFSDPVSKRYAGLLARWRSEAEERTGRPTRSFMLSGDAASEILQHAFREGYDLLVLGTHGRTGVARLFLGSVAEHVARRAPCPVLFVRHHPLLETGSGKERVEGGTR
jgi:nucleotide-binding universal stress UspA family protein